MTDIVSHSEPTREPRLPPQPNRRSRYLLIGFVAVGVAAVALTIIILPKIRSQTKPSTNSEPQKKLPTVALVEGKPETILIPDHVQKALGIEGTYKVELPKKGEGKPLLIPGSTQLDPKRVLRVRSRFNAEVREIKQVKRNGEKITSVPGRDIRSGDWVEKDEVLMVVWSLEIGLRKSDLADAIVQLRLDEQRLKDRIELYNHGNLPLDLLNQTRRDVITDHNNVDRAERNLRVWQVPPSEIKEVRDEAEAEAKAASTFEIVRDEKKNEDRFNRWAKSSLTAPISGSIIECNIGGVGEFLADNTINLFTIANVDRLQILAYPPEDQLPNLTALSQEDLKWTVKTVGTEPVEVPIEDISYILDQNQRTAVVKGYLPNPDRKLRAGQYLTAAVKMSAPKDVVEIPLTALAEDGKQSFVFVQSDPTKQEYTMRRVQVVRRFEETAYVRSKLTDEEEKLNAEEKKQGLPPRQPLVPDQDRILTSGVLELRAALDDLMSKISKKE